MLQQHAAEVLAPGNGGGAESDAEIIAVFSSPDLPQDLQNGAFHASNRMVHHECESIFLWKQRNPLNLFFLFDSARPNVREL